LASANLLIYHKKGSIFKTSEHNRKSSELRRFFQGLDRVLLHFIFFFEEYKRGWKEYCQVKGHTRALVK
jgi:hypothetical protein